MTTAAAAIHAPSRATQKYLMAAHVGALLHAAVLPGPVWAARLSTLGPGWQDMAGRAGRCSRHSRIAAEDTVNWLTGVKDESGEKAKTAPLGAHGAMTATTGFGIFLAGILAAL